MIIAAFAKGELIYLKLGLIQEKFEKGDLADLIQL